MGSGHRVSASRGQARIESRHLITYHIENGTTFFSVFPSYLCAQLPGWNVYICGKNVYEIGGKSFRFTLAASKSSWHRHCFNLLRHRLFCFGLGTQRARPRFSTVAQQIFNGKRKTDTIHSHPRKHLHTGLCMNFWHRVYNGMFES